MAPRIWDGVVGQFCPTHLSRRKTYLGTNEKCVELGENTEHLIRIASRPQAVTQSCNDLVFHASDAFIVRVLRSNPDLATLCTLIRNQHIAYGGTSWNWLTLRHVEDVYPLHNLVGFLDFRLHVHATHLGAYATKTLSGTRHHRKLLMLFPPIPKVTDTILKLRVRRDDLDGDKLLLTLASDFTRDVGEFLHMVVPRAEDSHCLREQAFERLVGSVEQSMRCQYAQELVVKVARDSFDEGEGTSDGVGGELQFTVNVTKDEDDCFLDLVQVGGGEQLVQREILHELIVLVHCGRVRSG